jgi:hypothetical protein
MGYGSALQRRVDSDLVERIEASGRPEPRKIATTRKTPRPAGSYRGSRRNEARLSGKPMLTYAELRRINAIHAHNRRAATSQA